MARVVWKIRKGWWYHMNNLFCANSSVLASPRPTPTSLVRQCCAFRDQESRALTLMYGSWPLSSSLASFSKRTFIVAWQSLQGAVTAGKQTLIRSQSLPRPGGQEHGEGGNRCWLTSPTPCTLSQQHSWACSFRRLIPDKAEGQHAGTWYQLERQMKAIRQSQCPSQTFKAHRREVRQILGCVNNK